MKPLAIDLFCGLGGWTEGLLAEGYQVIGFDIEQHVYGEKRYPAQLIVQDVLTLHGSQFKDAALIVASPPCQEYSYMAMPWSRAKQIRRALRGEGGFPAGYTGSRTVAELTALFDACFRIQREACEAADRHIPLVVENVRGANEWVGRSRWNFGSFHLWGDVPALMPPIFRGPARLKTHGGEQWNVHRDNFTGTQGWTDDGRKVPGFRFDGSGKTFQSASVHVTGVKAPGMNWSDQTKRGQDFTRIAGKHAEAGIKGSEGYARNHPEPFGWAKPGTSSHSKARKAASAMIAKIPLPLSRHIAAVFKPRASDAGRAA